jgi:hypothetical protein
MPVPGRGRPPTSEEVREVVELLVRLYAHKNPTYGDNWCRYGEFGVFDNVARKFGRIEVALADRHESPRIDDTVDLGVYGILQVAWHRANRPEEFAAWLEQAFIPER